MTATAYRAYEALETDLFSEQFHGVEVFTVPAEQRYALSQTPYLLAREVAALWYYWSRQVT